MIQNLQRLSALTGISGEETLVRDWLLSRLDSNCNVQVDALGNLIGFKKGKETPSKRVLLTTHMDEVGFLLTGVTADGLFKFTPVGALDERVVLGRAVRHCRTGLTGVIGTKAIHQQSPAERDAAVSMDDMFIDFGASSKEEALQAVQLGDSVSFIGSCKPLGSRLLKGKALDDRAGCAVLLRLLQSELPYDMYFAFTVQEKIGMRGAQTAAYTVHPDVAITLNGSEAADISGVPESKQLCALGKGAVLTFMDKGAIYDRELIQSAMTCAQEHDIPYQIKSAVDGIDGAALMQVSRGGVKMLSIGIPCRYLHSANPVLCPEDVESAYRLTEQMLKIL